MTHNTDTHRVHHIPPLELFKVMLSNPGDIPLVRKTVVKYIVNKPLCVYDAGD